MRYQAAIEELKNNACPSIQLGTRREILEETPDATYLRASLNEIQKDARVRHCLSLQGPDGWFGGHFHGEDEPEGTIRFLCDMGLDKNHPAVERGLQALLDREDFDRGSLENVGKHLDAAHLGGSLMIRACLLAQAGKTDDPEVLAQSDEALYGFARVLDYKNLDALLVPHKSGKMVFREGCVWPSIYHLRMLAYTSAWRSPANMEMVKSSVARLVALSPIPNANLLVKGQLISPATGLVSNYNADVQSMPGHAFPSWFHRMEMLARMGAADACPALEKQLNDLQALLDPNGGLFVKTMSDPKFYRWSAYSGIALEENWRQKQRRINDLSFRSLLILKYAGRL